MSRLLAPIVTSAGLVGGFKTARATGNRPLGGAVLAAAGVGAFVLWRREVGPARAAALTAVYLAAFGASHPLAKKIGAWPAVYSVAGGTALASLLFGSAPRR